MPIAIPRNAVRRASRSSAWVAGLLAMVWGVADRAAAEIHAQAAYQGPCSLVASKDTGTVYVANADSREVAWVDAIRGRIVRRVAVPGEPAGLALVPDGSKLCVACAASKSTVAVLDAKSGRQLSAIPAGHTAASLAVSPDGKRLYVCNRFSGDVSVIDLAAGTQVARVRAVREPIAVAVTPDSRTVLVGNHLPNARTDEGYRGDVASAITVIDARSFRTTTIELPHGATGVRGICVSTDGAHAFVTHLLSNFQKIPFRVDMGWINVNVISIIDLAQRKVVRTTGLDEQDNGAGNPWDIACTADGKTVCVSLSGVHQMAVIDRTVLLSESARTMSPMIVAWPIYPSLGSSLWRRISLPGKGPRAIAVCGTKAFVAQYFSDSLAVVDLQAGEGASIGTIPLGTSPQLTQERRGEVLFNDATICYQQWQSCASCHPDGRTDSLSWDLMNDGVGNPKNTKSMLLSHQTPPAMAEGVRMSAEEAVRSGIRHILFSDRPEEEAAAIDAYLKTLRPVPSPHLVEGRYSAAAERGRRLFESQRVGCSTCHPAPLYTDRKSHNVGSRGPNERGERFDTPTLIEVWRTAPYLHDGRYLTIKELLLEGRHGLRRGQHLSEQELDDLVEFVLSL